MLRNTILFIFLSLPLFGRTSATGWCSKGGQVVVTPAGANSTTQVMRSYPSCTVTVLTSMGGIATLFSDNAGTSLANPFTANAIGQWTFFADPDEYSITLSGSLINAPFTIQMFVGPGSGSAATGITTLNTLTGATQTFASGTTGTDFGIVSAGTTHTFNFPSSSAANRGLLTAADWTTFNAKQAALSFTAPLVNTAGTVALTLPITIGQGGTGQVTQAAAFTALSPQTTKGDLIAYSTLPIRFGIGTDGQVLSAASGQASGLQWITPGTPWVTSGSDIYYGTGNVGIGTAPGNYRLDVSRSGSTGTVRILDQTAATGHTNVDIFAGALQAGSGVYQITRWFDGNYNPATTPPAISVHGDGTQRFYDVHGDTLAHMYLKGWPGTAGPGSYMASDTGLRWNNNVNVDASNPDTGINRNAAGVVEVNNGTAGTIRDFKDRHTFCGGTAPTITTHFNTSGDSIAGGDDCGAVTVGSGAATNTGVITFGTAYATAPVCLAENQTTLAQGVQAVSTTTTLTLNGFLFSSGAAQNFTNGVILKYQCKTY